MDKEVKGVWRTVRGRRVFIKEGEDLKTAMINSGKFKEMRKSHFDTDDKLYNKKRENETAINKIDREIDKKDFFGGSLDEDYEKLTNERHRLMAENADIQKQRELNERKYYENSKYTREGLSITKEQFENLKRNSNVNNLAEKTMKENDESAKSYRGNTPEKIKEIVDDWKAKKGKGEFDTKNYEKHEKFVDGQIKAWEKEYDEAVKGYDARLKEMNDRDIVYKDTPKEYKYYTKHGMGPGAVPTDVKISNIKDYDDGMTSFETNRPLSSKELDFYSIENEIKNAEYDAKYGHNSTSDSKIKNYTNSSVQDLRKAMRNMKPYEEEIQVGGRVITKTSNGYGVRNQYDYDDPMTDYSAYVYGFKEKWIIDEAVKKGELKQTEIKSKVERFKERKGTSSSSSNGSVESLSKQALIEKLVDDQIARGVIKAENRALQIRARKNMTKSELLKYFK